MENESPAAWQENGGSGSQDSFQTDGNSKDTPAPHAAGNNNFMDGDDNLSPISDSEEFDDQTNDTTDARPVSPALDAVSQDDDSAVGEKKSNDEAPSSPPGESPGPDENVEDVEMRDVENERTDAAKEVDVDRENNNTPVADEPTETSQPPPPPDEDEAMDVDETDKSKKGDTAAPEETSQSIVEDHDSTNISASDNQPLEESHFQAVSEDNESANVSTSEADMLTDVINTETQVEDEESVQEIEIGIFRDVNVATEDILTRDVYDKILSDVHESIILENAIRVPDIPSPPLRSAMQENEIRRMDDDECLALGTALKPCLQCLEEKNPLFKMIRNNELDYFCSDECVNTFKTASSLSDVLFVTGNRIPIFPYPLKKPKDFCEACEKRQVACKFKLSDPDKGTFFLCDNDCMVKYTGEDWDKFVLHQGWFEVSVLADLRAEDEMEVCAVCDEEGKPCTLKIMQVGHVRNAYLLCDAACRDAVMSGLSLEFQPKKPEFVLHLDDVDSVIHDEEVALPRSERVQIVQQRKCQNCSSTIEEAGLSNIHWQLMDFCCSDCLYSYIKQQAGADNTKCDTCQEVMCLDDKSARFSILHGGDARSFCNESCLVRYKDTHRVCLSCTKSVTKDQPAEGEEAEAVTEQRFCSEKCKNRFDHTIARIKLATDAVTNILCHVCANERPMAVTCQVNNKVISLCSQACLSAFKFANNIDPPCCRTCNRYFEKTKERQFTVYSYSGDNCEPYSFCTRSCRDLYVVREAMGATMSCNWCGINKRECDLMRLRPFDDIYKPAFVCSVECERLLRFVVEQRSQGLKDTWSCTFCQTSTSFDAQRRLILLPAILGDSSSWRSFCSSKCARSSVGDELDETRFEETLRRITKPTLANLVEALLKPRPMLSVRDGASLQAPDRAGSNDSFPDYVDDYEFQAQPIRVKRGRGRPSTRGTSNRSVVIPTAPSIIPRMPEIRTQIVTVGPPPTVVRNCGTSCRPKTENRSTMAKIKKVSVECQTDSSLERRHIIPIPVPIYVPTPMPMYSLPVPTPVPIAIPIPVPVFIPTTRNSAEGIMKEIKKIQDKMPQDPYEAELLLMAEMVAEEAKKEESSSDSEDDRPLKTLMNNGQMAQEYHHLGSHAVAAHATVGASGGGGVAMEGEDMLMMALKMAYDEPTPVDLETTMAANTITQAATPIHHHMMYDQQQHHHHQEQQQQHHQIIQHAMGGHQQQQGHSLLLLESVQHEQYQQQPEVITPSVTRGRKRGSGRGGGRANNQQQIVIPQPVIQPPPANKRVTRNAQPSGFGANQEQNQREMEKAESNMCLKYTFGVNAWKQWVLTKNAELERGSSRRKPFKTDILSLTTEELNYSLSLFVKEVRKPNGSEYAPDTIYYLVLGIQQYLYENGRIDNIFTDLYFESFTNCLDDVAKKFSVLYNDSQYIVTRVEEEHLWECKQLGAHSPHVLLSTLMFFNTKHFNLTTVDEHMQLSFSHIMKHWKRGGGVASKGAGMRNVLLRFYPPQAALDANSRKKKVYEQSENEENPLRCPVKLYEFYLSKCPESVKTRNDVFYLLPERSCVPDSPVWYSTQALGQPALSKMLHRVKMVKEINIALLTS